MRKSTRAGLIVAVTAVVLMLAACSQQNPNTGTTSGYYQSNAHHGASTKQ